LKNRKNASERRFGEMKKSSNISRKVKQKRFLIFHEHSPVKITEEEYRLIVEQTLAVNQKQWPKHCRSELIPEIDSRQIRSQGIADLWDDNITVDNFAKKYLGLIRTMESILCQGNKFISEIFFVAHILENDYSRSRAVAERRVNDQLISFLMHKLLHPKLQALKKKVLSKIFFLILKVPKNQSNREKNGLIVRHVDIFYI